MYRTHTCGELRPEHAGQETLLAGWVHRRRDHGGLIFLDLRDRYGLTQVVFNPPTAPEAHAVASQARRSTCSRCAAWSASARPRRCEPELPTGGDRGARERRDGAQPGQDHAVRTSAKKAARTRRCA